MALYPAYLPQVPIAHHELTESCWGDVCFWVDTAEVEAWSFEDQIRWRRKRNDPWKGQAASATEHGQGSLVLLLLWLPSLLTFSTVLSTLVLLLLLLLLSSKTSLPLPLVPNYYHSHHYHGHHYFYHCYTFIFLLPAANFFHHPSSSKAFTRLIHSRSGVDHHNVNGSLSLSQELSPKRCACIYSLLSGGIIQRAEESARFPRLRLTLHVSYTRAVLLWRRKKLRHGAWGDVYEITELVKSETLIQTFLLVSPVWA